MAGHPPRGRPPTNPTARSPNRACRPTGQCWASTPTHPRPHHVGGGPQQPAPGDGRPGEGQCLTPDAPHNSGRHPPRGRPSAVPTASNAGPQGRTLWGRSWVPTPAPTAPGTHRGRGTLAARSRGRAAGGGTAPDTRRSSQRWQASPPRPSPRHAAPTGQAGQGDSVRPPHPHTRAHSTWVADPNSPPSGRAVRGGTAPDLRRHSQWWKASPRGRPSATPTASNASPQGCTLWGRCWVPTPAPTAPGTHGPRNPGCPLQRTGGRGRDSA